jgi:hypothetical protein
VAEPMSVQERLMHTPAVVVGIISGAFTGAIVPVLLILMGRLEWDGRALILGAVTAVVSGIAADISVWWLRKSSPEPRDAIRLNAALKSGRIPADATTDGWLDQLEDRERLERPLRWAGPLLFGGMGILNLLTVIAEPNSSAFQGALSVVLLALAVFYPFWTRRSLARISCLRASLVARQNAPLRAPDIAP